MPKEVSVEEIDKLRAATATAVSALADASATATSFGIVPVARAADSLRFVLISERPEKLPPSAEIQTRISDLESAMTAAQLPMTEPFKCRHDREQCLASAKSDWGRKECWILYAACLADLVARRIQGSSR